jgi:splicing factor 3B subunit 4
MRGTDGASRGYAFLSYDSFESSDAAINAMNGQFLEGKPISVTYALKKDSKVDRHGSAAERIIAANNPNSANKNRPHSLFAVAPPPPGMPGGFMGGMPPMMGMPPPPMMGMPHGGMPMHMPPGLPPHMQMPYPPPY